jgi:hypothetical protein
MVADEAMQSITESLKELAAKHSYMKIHTELLALMKDEYAALKAFFEPEAPKKKRTTPHEENKALQAVQAVEQPPEEHRQPKVIANTKIRIIKASEPVNVENTAASEQKRMDSKELKAWQKEQEAKKAAELSAAGITPESLLTAESIKRWIEDEGRTFAYVAREHVGLPEATVADFAKTHGVKSKISKTRAILSAKNRRP